MAGGGEEEGTATAAAKGGVADVRPSSSGEDAASYFSISTDMRERGEGEEIRLEWLSGVVRAFCRPIFSPYRNFGISLV